MKRCGIHGINIVPYHPQSNGLVERGHQMIINALAEYSAAAGHKKDRT